MTTQQELQEKLAPIRDQVRSVALRHSYGYYLYGNPGTGKSYVVRETLKAAGVKFIWHQGHITAKALFDLFMDHFDSVIVLDDVSQIFKDTIACQVILAALGTQDQNKKYRIIKWAKNNQSLQVPFLGGVIAISNLGIADDPVSRAIASRVPYNDYNLTDDDISLIIRTIAAKGTADIPPKTCQEIADFVIAEATVKKMRLDLRLYCDKALAQYRLWLSGETETGWQDLIRSTMNVTLFRPNDVKLGPTKREQQIAEIEIVRQIRTDHAPNKQVAAWKKATGKSQATFYRIVKLLEAQTQLDNSA